MQDTKPPSPDRKAPPPKRRSKLTRSVYGVGEGFPPRGSGPGEAADERPAGPTAADPGNRGPAPGGGQRETKE